MERPFNTGGGTFSGGKMGVRVNYFQSLKGVDDLSVQDSLATILKNAIKKAIFLKNN